MITTMVGPQPSQSPKGTPVPPGRRPKLPPDAEHILREKLERAKWISERSNEDLFIEVYEANRAGMPYAAIGRTLGMGTETAREMGVKGEQARSRRLAGGPVGPSERGKAD